MNEPSKIIDRQNNRLYLDIVKGVAIFLMLWGHCIQYCTNGEFDFFENPVFKFIYSFHMPLFMLVSGYLFFFSCKRRSFSQLLLHRTQSLLQPILMCGIFNYFLTVVIYQRTITSVIDGPWIGTLGSLWFLWSVLAAGLVVAVAHYCASNIALKILILLVGAGVVCLFPNWAMNLYMYPYFVFGFVFAKYMDKLPKWLLNLKYIFLVVFPVMLLFFKKKHYIYTTGIVSSDSIPELIMIDGFRWAIGLAGSIFMMVILELLHRFVFLKKPALAKPIANLGIKSLQMYCISVSVLSFWLPKLFSKICSLLGSNVFASNMIVYNYLFTPCLTIVFAILIYYVIKLLEKIKASRVLFGR